MFYLFANFFANAIYLHSVYFFVSDYSNPEAVKFFILPKDTMLCCKYGIYARSFDDHFESVYVLTYTSA